MIIIYGSEEIELGLVDEAVEALKLDCGLLGEKPTRIMYDQEYYVFDTNNESEEDMLAATHYLDYYKKDVNHSPEGDLAGNYMTTCVAKEHIEKQIECHCGLEDCRIVDIGVYCPTLANGARPTVYYIS